jgi:hypothetical protein
VNLSDTEIESSPSNGGNACVPTKARPDETLIRTLARWQIAGPAIAGKQI